MSRFVVIGARGGEVQGAPSAPNRLEINQLIRNKMQFSLYIQAIAALSALPQDELLSFFQVGGIHGLPYAPWNDSGDKPLPKSWGGYCTHGSVLFPTWHRPYVALYEQLLQQHAIAIANTYPDKERWVAAASCLRAPYWDWASNVVPPTEVIAMEKISILTASGPAEVDNPLLRYKFNPIDPCFPEPYSAWKTTLRRPTSKGADATSNVEEMVRELEAEAVNLRASTYSLLSRVRTWPDFSNHTLNGGSASSLESIHDSIHVMIGGDGHMGDPAVAGFDPIFFLHHANVDRLLSLWSALHPESWVTKGAAVDGSFTIGSDSTVDGTTDLTPFWNSQVSFWVSTQVTGTVPLGYTYPEFNDIETNDPNSVRLEIARKVHDLYGSAVPTRIPVAPSIVSSQDDPTVAVTGPEEDDPSTGMWDWTARVRFKKYELGGSFQVLIFLGPVPASSEEWGTCSTYVGAVRAFVNSVREQCHNCNAQGDLEIQGFVDLNDAIAARSGLTSFSPQAVAPYLTQALNWRVQMGNRAPVALSQLPSLEVSVFSTPLSHEPGEVFPCAGEAIHHHHITHGREGGCRCPNEHTPTVSRGRCIIC